MEHLIPYSEYLWGEEDTQTNFYWYSTEGPFTSKYLQQIEKESATNFYRVGSLRESRGCPYCQTAIDFDYRNFDYSRQSVVERNSIESVRCQMCGW